MKVLYVFIVVVGVDMNVWVVEGDSLSLFVYFYLKT